MLRCIATAARVTAGSAGADRAPARHVVRLAVIDGARFHGNICCLDPAQIRPGGSSWGLEGGPLLLRACSRDSGSGDRQPLQVWLLTGLKSRPYVYQLRWSGAHAALNWRQGQAASVGGALWAGCSALKST